MKLTKVKERKTEAIGGIDFQKENDYAKIDW